METKDCQICFNQIPAKAKKCQYCHEWQGKKEDFVKDDLNKYKILNFNDKFPQAKKPFQLLLVQKIPFHYVVTVLILCIICFVGVQLSWYAWNEERIYLISFLFGILQLMVTWSGIIWFYNILKENFYVTIQISNQDFKKAEDNFIKAHAKIFNSTNAILVGIVVGLIASIGDYVVGTPFKSDSAKYLFAACEFVIMFFAGAAIYSMVIFAYYLNKIRIETTNDFISYEKGHAINIIGKIHLKSSILAIVPLFLGVFIKLFGEWNWNVLVIIWYIFFAIAIVFYIYWPVQNIHKLMKANIDSQIGIIHIKIQKLLHEINYNPSSRNFAKLHELRTIENSISNQNTWPFDAKSISAAFLAIIFPIILIFVDKIWSI